MTERAIGRRRPGPCATAERAAWRSGRIGSRWSARMIHCCRARPPSRARRRRRPRPNTSSTLLRWSRRRWQRRAWRDRRQIDGHPTGIRTRRTRRSRIVRWHGTSSRMAAVTFRPSAPQVLSRHHSPSSRRSDHARSTARRRRSRRCDGHPHPPIGVRRPSPRPVPPPFSRLVGCPTRRPSAHPRMTVTPRPIDHRWANGNRPRHRRSVGA